jgi:ABC-type sugar transport system ATPase subunit
LRLVGLSKAFPGGVRAVDGVDLEVAPGELLAIVGPSGCGKTTLLRLVAGLERPTGGEAWLGGERLDPLPPRQRRVAMVFQQPALYPGRTVAGNLSFGLRLRGVPQAEIERRVAQAAAAVGLEGLLDRRPETLSGGEQQRVALGRALAGQPRLFLFDEPLSQLDAPVRAELRAEIKALLRRLGVPTLYVTHDQEEALWLGDRVAVMRAGRFHQVASPQSVYHAPADRFVAGFVGAPAMNFLAADVTSSAACPRVSLLGREWAAASALEAWVGRTVSVGLRPEDVRIAPPGRDSHLAAVAAEVLSIADLGDRRFATLLAEDGVRLTARLTNDQACVAGQRVGLVLDLARAHYFEPDEAGLSLAADG